MVGVSVMRYHTGPWRSVRTRAEGSTMEGTMTGNDARTQSPDIMPSEA